jgi:hypothetical protein
MNRRNKMRLSEIMKKVPLLASANINAGVDSDSINMKLYHGASFDIVFGPSYAGAAGAIIKLYSGATDGAKTTAMTFNYRYGSGAIKATDADILTTESTSAALQIATATMVSRLLTIEIDATEMPDGHSWLTFEIGAEADAGEMTIMAHLYPRYSSAAGVTCLE